MYRVRFCPPTWQESPSRRWYLYQPERLWEEARQFLLVRPDAQGWHVVPI